MEVLRTTFTVIGFIAVLGIVLMLLFIVIDNILDYMLKLKYRYKYKHRFGIKPTAKCYCRDCKKWNEETGECNDPCNSRHMAETWFCCFAEPIDKR